MDQVLNDRLTQYLNAIKNDYAEWGKKDLTDSDPIKVQIRRDMISDFNAKIRVEQGSKYIKVVSNGGVHSFIVIKPDAKFKYGDILRPVSWAAPARNFARGNLFTDFGKVRWTSPS